MEFKRLSDVAVVAEPAESANVLIEENGVIKKAPKTAVGGGAGALIVVADYDDYSKVSAPDGFYSIIDEMYNDHSKIQPILLVGLQHGHLYPTLCNFIFSTDGYYRIGFGNFELSVYRDGVLEFYYSD